MHVNLFFHYLYWWWIRKRSEIVIKMDLVIRKGERFFIEKVVVGKKEIVIKKRNEIVIF